MVRLLALKPRFYAGGAVNDEGDHHQQIEHELHGRVTHLGRIAAVPADEGMQSLVEGRITDETGQPAPYSRVDRYEGVFQPWMLDQIAQREQQYVHEDDQVQQARVHVEVVKADPVSPVACNGHRICRQIRKSR
ncbi:MAG: hypothetical protein NVV69_05210 [Methyloversatilis sp.]|uniref:hypothetical protein n=1 Tax=Methyloversatilis sp. TaxID=2569862 RepID=UPI0025DA2829|nr:hypothetical protein [Methyloversatilis sp.]MCR6665411.1 hypothetical protein [Methyloversatilis sp.]